MNLWVGAVALGLAMAGVVLGLYVSFRVLGFPDLTMDGSFPLGAAVSAVLLVWGWEPWMTLPFAALAGALAGACTAFLNGRLRINGLLAGILVSLGLYTVNLRIMGDKSNVPLLSVDTVLTGLRPYLAEPNLRGVVVFGLVMMAFGFALKWLMHTHLGLALRATGDNERMVRAQGIDADRMRLLGLSLANALVGVSGALVAQYQGFADITMGLGMIVSALASLIIGETLIRPLGVGLAILAAVVGSVVYRVVIAAALFIGLGPTDMRLVTSIIVAAALAIPQLRSALAPRGFTLGGAR
ncbi:MAG: ABC transporter permease [Chloroflexota bacterium]